MRLLDKILASGYSSLLVGEERESLDGTLKEANLVVVDNVAAYYFQGVTAVAGSPPTLSEFPCVMPPLDPIFLEMRIPAHPIVSRDEYDQGGVLGTIVPREMVDSGYFPKGEPGKILSQEGISFYFFCDLFLWSCSRRMTIHAGSFTIPINKEGGIVSSNKYPQFVGKIELPEHKAAADTVDYFASIFLYPCLLGISFMHCKNVKVVRDAPPLKLSRSHEKKTGKPLLRYHVLQIDHMKEILEREGEASKTGLTRALHICRGHFNIYGEDGKGKLFGKHEGRFWIPMHTRGNRKEGVVVKDYKVQ